MRRKILKFGLTVAGLALSSWLSAQDGNGQNYTPPSTPELYDVNEPLVPAYVRIRKVKSHPYLGLGVGAGSSRLNGGNGTPKASWDFDLEGGYVKAISTWSRADLGVEAFAGQIGDSLNTLHIKGGLVKIGYGYNLSENLYALLRAGYGLAAANYTGPRGDDSSATGNLWQLGIQMIAPTNSALDILGGAFFTQYGFADKGVYSTFGVKVGVRLRL